MRAARLAAVVLVAVALGAAAALPVALAAGGRWDGPSLSELDLGAAGAEAADGTWRVEELVVDGDAVPLVDGAPVVVSLDTTQALLVAEAGCSRLLGSFTLRPGGAASFTVPSAPVRGCDQGAQAREGALRRVLEEAERWAVEDGRLLVAGPGGHLVARPA